MLLQNRIEHSVKFRAVTKMVEGISPHWESEGERVIMVIPPDDSNSSWQVFALPDGKSDGFSIQIAGSEKTAEDAAFLVATRGRGNTS